MIRAAIYYRVSTDGQERDGTSLETQLAKCLEYCQSKSYDVSFRFSESYSGLSLERPKLDELRELARNGEIDVIVIYSLDRYSRDPTHGVILTEELDKHGVKLESVTEDIDNSELGKLISYIRGYAAMIEAAKIKERTMRGKKAAKEAGKIFCGSGAGIYGYDYHRRIKGQSDASRSINEGEGEWVKRIYAWLVNECLSTTAITLKLRALGAPTKTGKTWGKATVRRILRNVAYAGGTNATPAIISPELFNDAQKQLEINFAKSPRNCKHDYLLRGHIRCRCGQAFIGMPSNGKYYYACLGKRKISLNPVKCDNKVWPADKIESLVLRGLQDYLSKPEVIKYEIEQKRNVADNLGVFTSSLMRVDNQLKSLDREQGQLLSWALKGFPENQVVATNTRINAARKTLTAEKVDLEAKIKASQDAIVDIPKLEAFLGLVNSRITDLTFAGKRLALDWLSISVIVDGENVDATGAIKIEAKSDECIVITSS